MSGCPVQLGASSAGYSGGVKIRGRVLINGACGTIFGDGMNDDEYLLTFDTGQDPWFRNFATSCREFVLRYPKGKSIWHAKGTTHDLIISYWPMVKEFLSSSRQ